METFKVSLIACSLCILLTVTQAVPQSNKNATKKSVSSPDLEKAKESKREEPGDYFPPDEIQSRFRYVIVNDDLQSFDSDDGKGLVPVRRYVQVLIDKRAFNRANLIDLFKYLSNYYATPTYLDIEIHTSLMTLETLEERAADTTHSKRDNFRTFYKTAGYSRFNDGSEIFMYDVGKPGRFINRFVKLTRTTKK